MFSKKTEGYYLNENGFYERCFESCENCYGLGNERYNNCSTCKSGYIFLNDSWFNFNFYEKCQYYYYFNETNDYICTQNCSGNFCKLIFEKKKCINDCKNDSIYKYEYNNICYEECPNGTIYNLEIGICVEEKYTGITVLLESEKIINEDFITIIIDSITNKDNIIKTILSTSLYLTDFSVLNDRIKI